MGHWEQSDRHLLFFATFNIRGTLREPDLCPGATGKCNGTFVNDKVHASKKPIITTIIKGSLSIFVKNRCWQARDAAKWRSPSIFDWIDLTTGKGKAYHVIAWACPWTSHKSNWSLSSNIKVPIIERTFSQGKGAVLLDFVQITLNKGDKKVGKGPPLIWTKSKRTALFPQENVPHHLAWFPFNPDLLKSPSQLLISSFLLFAPIW